HMPVLPVSGPYLWRKMPEFILPHSFKVHLVSRERNGQEDRKNTCKQMMTVYHVICLPAPANETSFFIRIVLIIIPCLYTYLLVNVKK
ncbi:MAG: hypothetical protein ACQES0_02300, partial [Bacteroidota bacterium]